MARTTHDLGRMYCHAMRVPRGGPVLQLGTSHEVEEPWRVGRCAVLRLWKLALVVGWWGPGRSRTQMLADEGLEGDVEELVQEVEVPVDDISAVFIPEERPEDETEWVVR